MKTTRNNRYFTSHIKEHNEKTIILSEPMKVALSGEAKAAIVSCTSFYNEKRTSERLNEFTKVVANAIDFGRATAHLPTTRNGS